MEAIVCRGCGSVEFDELDSFSECVYCGTRYIPEKREVKPERSIGLNADIEALLEKCRKDPANSQRYANLILDIDPHNTEARAFL